MKAFSYITYGVIASLIACTTDTTSEQNDSTTEGDTSTAPLSTEGQWAAGYAEEMQAMVDSSEDFAKLNALEALVEQGEQQLFKEWQKAWKSGNTESYTSLIAAQNAGIDWENAQTSVTREMNGIIESALTFPSGTDSAEQYLSGLTVQDFTLRVVHVEEQTSSAVFTLEFDLRAERGDGTRVQDRGHITVTTTKADTLKIQSMAASTFERLQLDRQPAYIDQTTEWGLAGTLPIQDRKEAIRRGGYALVVADYDQDGMTDMLVGNYGPINLLRNTGSGFEDVTAAAGLDAEEVIKGAGFVDMDNDGDRDIVMLRFTDSTDPRGDFVIYENDGVVFFRRNPDLRSVWVFNCKRRLQQRWLD